MHALGAEVSFNKMAFPTRRAPKVVIPCADILVGVCLACWCPLAAVLFLLAVDIVGSRRNYSHPYSFDIAYIFMFNGNISFTIESGYMHLI